MAIKFHWMLRKGWPNTQPGLIQMAQDLEEANIVSVLLPYGPHGVDFSLYVPQILKSTKKIKMMLALAAYSLTPEYAAKTFVSMQEFGWKRLDLNLVAGNYDEIKQDFVISHYPLDVSLVNSHEKRVELTQVWMEKFVSLMKSQKFKAKLCVVGSSDTTISIADKYAHYIIIGDYMLGSDFLPRLSNTKPILLIDPLIIQDGQEVQYHDYEYRLPPKHNIKGTHEQVVDQIKKISQEFNVNDFMILTDQKDLTSIFKVIKELTEPDSI